MKLSGRGRPDHARHGTIRRLDAEAKRESTESTSRRSETVWRLYNEGWAVGNLDLITELLDPRVVWTAIEDAPDAGTYRGHEGVRRYWLDWLGDFDLHPFRIEEAIEARDRLVCVQRAATTGKGSGVRSELVYACIYWFDDGERITEVREYATREEAMEAAGLTDA
jgi:ketosteroid isomerase-like protein